MDNRHYFSVNFETICKDQLVGVLRNKLYVHLRHQMMKTPRVPSKLTTSLLNLSPGKNLFIDFSLINIVIVIFFTSYLSVTDDTKVFSFKFPTRYKRAPVDLIQFLIKNLRQKRKTVKFHKIL